MDDELNRLHWKVRGMMCSTCEDRVSQAAKSVAGVQSAEARQSEGRLSVTLEAHASAAEVLPLVEQAVAAAGYTLVGQTSGTATPATVTVFVVAAGLIAVFLLAGSQGWFNFLPTIDSSVGLGMIFVAGLLTSVHCVAMCGGIALSQQTRVPGLKGLPYHLGRIVSYTLLGGVVGALGSVISFSPTTKGLLAGVAGLFMVGLGLKMLGWLPRLSWLRIPRLPRRWRTAPRFAGFTLTLRSRGPFFVGLLNGLMPCGPLQTMQLYALGTGSIALGALSMFLFSVGTVPLMFAFGALNSFFSAKWQHRLVRASALLVVFFGVVMSGRALDLSGASGPLKSLANQVAAPDQVAGTELALVKNGVQSVSFDLQPNRYSPITVQKGIPVEWTINATADTLNGCNGEIVVPQLGLRKKLAIGANLIRFIPTQAGTIGYTCWMGMISSSIRVVDDPAQAPPLVPTEAIQKAEFKTEQGKTIQVVTVTVDDRGYSPAVMVVQKGVPTRFNFVVQSLSGCNSYVDFPAYGAGLDLAQGQTQTPLLPVVQDFVFQCGMAMLHGYVRVVPDLAAADLSEVRATAAAWKPAPGSGGCCGG